MEVRALTEADAQAIATWRYPGRYSTYDVKEVITSDGGFWAVTEGVELVGYCCFGYEARVPGVDEEPGTLDIGYGMRPDLVGNRLGTTFVTAITEFALRTFPARRHRLLILTWNHRSLKVAKKLGFEEHGIASSDEGDFVIMLTTTSLRDT